MTQLLLWPVVMSCLLSVLFSGCRSMTPPVTYYTFRAMAGEMAPSSTDGAVSVTIGIQPVQLPGYINRTQMVRRTGAHQLEIASLHRWADYPDRLVQQVIGDNLQVLMPHARVVNAPWPTGLHPDISVAFQFLELIGTTDEKILLNAVWTITGKAGPSAQMSHRRSLTETISGSGYGALAAAHSRILALLCQEVAATLDG
ncbi:MAG: PqiC family protein [Desulfosarcina sp.]|jgi:hypothetical protein